MHVNRRLLDIPFMLRRYAWSTEPDERLATGFIVTMPVDTPPDEEYSYQHAYAVTARHCAFSDASGTRTLGAESPWMDAQPLTIGKLPGDQWRHLRADDLLAHDDPERNLPDEEWVDIAVQPSSLANYSGVVIGQSLRAVPYDSLLIRAANQRGELLGAETASVGLFHYYRGTDKAIEPIIRFGRVAMEPVSTVRGAEGRMQAIFVESFAAQGMSGAPVFVDTGLREPALLGIHVGHAPEFSPRGTVADANVGHSGISLVAPAEKLAQLLGVEDLKHERRRIASAVIDSPWRFRDRRHRERAHLTLTEEAFLDVEDYLNEHPPAFRFLLLAPRDSPRPAIPDYWNALDVVTMGETEPVIDIVAEFFTQIKWRESHYRSIGWGTWRDGAVYASVSLYRDGAGDVEAVLVEIACEEFQAATGHRLPSQGPFLELGRRIGATLLVDEWRDVALALSPR